MHGKDNYTGLVQRAQLGDKESLNRLGELVRERLREYVFRLTLADDLTQDILQESMLKMFKFLDKLERADRFWPWLRRIAANKIRDHYGQNWNRKRVSISEKEYRGIQKDSQDGLADMVSQELKQIVFAAMHRLKPAHRNILILRCYEEMKYSEIAEEMGCSELAARTLFFRAKKALAKELSRRGLGKSSLVVALALFGKMTASSEAAAANVSVTAATLKVGAAASLAAVVTSKTAIISLVTAGAIGAGAVAIAPRVDKTDIGTRKYQVENTLSPSRQITASRGREECWYYYPPNANGSVIMRLLSGREGEQSYCQWLQNDQANYYKYGDDIYINNHRVWVSDLTVQRLPTDSPRLTEFLSTIEGKSKQIKYVQGNRDGLLVIVKQDRNGGHSQTTLRYDVSDEEYFRYSWPAGARIIDNRDAMHKRGWTYFRITGRIGGEEVSGVGRIPFVYASSKLNYAWLTLTVGTRLKIMDGGDQACVYDGGGKLVATYAGGGFFKGLGRPWMGLHTIDTVRRDAAEKQIWFETELLPGGKKAQVTLTCGQDKLIYTIDMDVDVVDKVTFTGSQIQGELKFAYLQEIGQTTNEFVAPSQKSSGKQQGHIGILWLVKLMSNQW